MVFLILGLNLESKFYFCGKFSFCCTTSSSSGSFKIALLHCLTLSQLFQLKIDIYYNWLNKLILKKCDFQNICQALSISQSLNLSLSLRDRDRADTIITLPHHHHHHQKLFKHLEVTYSQVWYIIGIVSSSPTHFHSEKIGLIRVTYDLPCQY